MSRIRAVKTNYIFSKSKAKLLDCINPSIQYTYKQAYDLLKKRPQMLLLPTHEGNVFSTFVKRMPYYAAAMPTEFLHNKPNLVSKLVKSKVLNEEGVRRNVVKEIYYGVITLPHKLANNLLSIMDANGKHVELSKLIDKQELFDCALACQNYQALPAFANHLRLGSEQVTRKLLNNFQTNSFETTESVVDFADNIMAFCKKDKFLAYKDKSTIYRNCIQRVRNSVLDLQDCVYESDSSQIILSKAKELEKLLADNNLEIAHELGNTQLKFQF